MLNSIAWRNLWRNPRRTILTVIAVAGGLAMIIALYGMIAAWGDRMLDGITGTYIGHIQIHEEGFRSKRGTAKAISNADLVLTAVRETPGVEGAAGRIYGFAHASFVRGSDEEARSGEGEDVSSPVVSILGVDPTHEASVTNIPEKIVEGRWLEHETDVIIGASLARRIKAQIGDAFLPTVVDLSGATRGPWAVSDRVPRVVGIARTGIDDIDNRMVLMSGDYLAQLMNMGGEVHEITIRAAGPLDLEPQVEAIRTSVATARQQAERSEQLPTSTPLIVRVEGASPEPQEADAGAPPPQRRITLVGVDAALDRVVEETEERSARLTAGRFIARSEDIVLSQELATELGVSVGDRINVEVPLDCGEDVAAEECPPTAEPFLVAGIVGGSGETLDGSFGLVAATVLRDNIGGLAPAVIQGLADEPRGAITVLLADIRGDVGANDEVLAWYDLAPEMHQMLAMMDVGPMIFLVIVFLAVALGIVNTLLMATFERTREIGIMRALGMGSWRVVAMVMAESFQLSLVGTALGILLGLAIVWYWSAFGLDLGIFMGEEGSFDISGISFDPVLWPRIVPASILKASIPVIIITTLAGVYPAIRASRLQPTDALRHE